MKKVDIGTCSWKYPSWKGIIYSESKHINYLHEYAQHFSTVEIDQWFWSLFGEETVKLPERETAEEYRGSVPEDFSFSVKVPNSITLTHFYKKKKTDPLAANPYFMSDKLFFDFYNTLGPLQDRVAAYIMQFEYLNKQKIDGVKSFLNALKLFKSKVDRLVPGLPLAVETRNKNYLGEAYFSFLQENSFIPVFVQGYWMPPVWQLYDKYKAYLRNRAVIRLMGPDRGDIEKKTGKKWNTVVEPRDDELEQIARMIVDMQRNNISVLVNINNHYEGSAPLTIERLEERIEQSRIEKSKIKK